MTLASADDEMRVAMDADNVRDPLAPDEKTPNGGADGSGVSPMRAVDRALAVLCAFSRETPSLGVTDLSERLGLTKSTVHRLLQALMARGMVAQDPDSRDYTLGYRVLALAQAVSGEANLRRLCHPHMVWLRSVTQETIGLYVVAGDVRMCLDELESPQVLRMAAGIGRTFPLDRGAASKALLAEGAANADLWQRATELLSAEQITRLLEEIATLRRRGYAASSGETVQGSASIAAPISAAHGAVIAALSVAGPSARFDAAAITRYAALLLEAVGRISRDLATLSGASTTPGAALGASSVALG